MKKGLIYLLLMVLCVTMSACSSTFGMEEQNVDSSTVSLNIGDYVLLGKYYDKPILWRCVDIDENGMLMLSEKLLCRKPFDVSGKNGSNSRRGHSLKTCSNYWGDSNIRSWLNSAAADGEVVWLCGNPPTKSIGGSSIYDYNGYNNEKGFLSKENFTQLEQDVIKEVTQKSLLDPADFDLAMGGNDAVWRDIYSGNNEMDIQAFVENTYDEICFENVTDKVFLLDAKQLCNIYGNKDMLGEDCYKATFTQEAIDNDEVEQYRVSQNKAPLLSTEQASSYWLRTPLGWGQPYSGRDPWYESGDRGLVEASISFNQVYIMDADRNFGIRPAFYLNETSAQIISGSGTEQDPYVIDGKKNDNIHVYCDGWELKFDVQPVNENGRVLVPMRKIFETLGASIDWNESTCTVTAVKDETTVSLQIDQREMYVNGEMIWLDVPPKIVDNRTLIPLRAISEALGANVEWIEESRRVNITT